MNVIQETWNREPPAGRPHLTKAPASTSMLAATRPCSPVEVVFPNVLEIPMNLPEFLYFSDWNLDCWSYILFKKMCWRMWPSKICPLSTKGLYIQTQGRNWEAEKVLYPLIMSDSCEAPYSWTQKPWHQKFPLASIAVFFSPPLAL